MLRRACVVLVAVVGALAVAASTPAQPLVLESESEFPGPSRGELLSATQPRLRLRASVDASDVSIDVPTQTQMAVEIASRFDEQARAAPGEVRAGFRAPELIDEIDTATLTFFAVDETHVLQTGVDVADVLLVWEGATAGVVRFDLSFSGVIGGAGDIDFSGTLPSITVERVDEDE